MSIARQRREGAAALAMLMREKFEALQEAGREKDEARAQRLALELALLSQNNTPFLIFVLETYAGTIRKLPGGAKPSHKEVPKHHDSLVDAVQSDIEYENVTKH